MEVIAEGQAAVVGMVVGLDLENVMVVGGLQQL